MLPLAIAAFVLAAPQGFEPAGPLARPRPAPYGELRTMLPIVLDRSGTRVVLGDVNGDLDPDLVGIDRKGGMTLLNLGYGVFRRGPRPGTPVSPDGTRPLDLALGDLDGDADLDLVACITSQGFHVAANDGTGRFTTVASPALGGIEAQTFALGDADGDGVLDLFLADRLFRGLGAAQFAEVPGAVPPVPAGVSDVELGDLDGDGDPDAFLAVSSGTVGNVLLLRDASGTWIDASAQVPAPALWAQDAALGDVDGDGDLDVLVANYAAPGVQPPTPAQPNQLFENDGAGAFADATADLGGAAGYSTAVHPFDLEGDGDLDVIFGNSAHVALDGLGNPYRAEGGWNSLHRNDGAGVFAASSSMDTFLNVVPTLVAGDVDGDGDADLVTSGDRLRLLLGDGAGALRLDRPGAVPQTTTMLAFGDLNADGHVDVASGFLLLGDGAGGFERREIPPNAAAAVALGDVDGDGDLDLLAVNPYDGSFVGKLQDHGLFLNDGSAVLTDESHRLPVHSPPFGDDRGIGQCGLLVDVNGDGDLDAVIGERDDYDGGGGGVTLYANDGSGFFSDASGQVLAGPRRVDRVRAGDVEGDGDVDLVVLGEAWAPDFGTGLHLLANDGAGTYTVVPGALPASEGDTTDLRWMDTGDVDADGDLDVAGGWIAYDGEHVEHGYFARNDGSGSFDLAALPAPLASFGFADVDGDADLDLVSPALLLELGPSGYRPRADWRPPTGGFSGWSDLGRAQLWFHDVDHDGDVDAYPVPPPLGMAVSEVVLWTNLARQLARSGTPGIGKPLHLQIFGPAGESWLLARSLGRGWVPTPYGLLLLAPPGLALVAAGSANGSGLAEVALPVPPIQGLVGATIHWQALVGSAAPRWTNLEITTLTDL